jgi:hypothetical protein
MHEHLPTLGPHLLDPLAYRLKLRLKRVDAIVAYTLDIEDLDLPLTLLDPK